MSTPVKIIILLIVLVLADFAIVKYVDSPDTFILKTLFNPSAGLEEVVKKALLGSKGTYSVAIKDLKTGRSYYLNEKEEFEAASLYKVWVLAEVENQIQKGKIREDEILKQEVTVLNEKFNISSESAELTEGEVSLSVKSAMQQMIVISHNYAGLLLAEKVRLSNISSFIKENGFVQTSLGKPPKTTAHDVALYFEKLYKGELVNKVRSEEMLALFKKQQLNDKLPKYLPIETVVAHKTGELGYYSHDGGIVFGTKSDYIIVILSKSNYPPGAVERIAAISKAVYDYFEK